MFAFAIWDLGRRRIFCARDRLGIKPFYYLVRGGRLLFASEIKALFSAAGVRPVLNRRALPEYLTFGYLSSKETLFEGVQKLMPGHWLSLDLDKGAIEPQIEKYWDLDITKPKLPLSEADCVLQFRELFEETVKLHLMSDVPLGVFLSGGLDSSAIAAVMAGLRKDRIQTFSVGYSEESFSELPYARIVAKHIHAEHHEVLLGSHDFLSALPMMIYQEDEPIVWPSSVPLYYVSRLASKKVKVVLTGEGGDELFAGYLKYRVTLWNLKGGMAYWKLAPQALQTLVQTSLQSDFLPDFARRKLRHSFLNYPNVFEKIYFENFYAAFAQEEQKQLFTETLADELAGVSPYKNSLSYFAEDGENGMLLDRLLYLDIKTYLVELLMKQDQMSMAASIESRVPFLDHRLVEFAMRVHPHQKLRRLSGKYLLRRAMADKLPHEVLQRTKKGFPTPIRPWLRNQLFGQISTVLDDGRMAERGIFRQDTVQKLLRQHQQGSSAATERVWRLLNFELWCRIFLDGDRGKPVSVEPSDSFAAKAVVQ